MEGKPTSEFAEREGINVRKEVTHEGITWNLVIHDINDGFSCGLRDTGPKPSGELYLLDYHFEDVSTARMHMAPGAEKDIPWSEKIERLKLWVKVIKAFNGIMTSEVKSHIRKNDLLDMLANGRLPRLRTIVASTGNESLIKFLKRAGATEAKKPPHDLSIDWNKFLELVESREK